MINPVLLAACSLFALSMIFIGTAWYCLGVARDALLSPKDNRAPDGSSSGWVAIALLLLVASAIATGCATNILLTNPV